jgi:xanthine dehydrogenase molybdopterin binding subunit/xanthine dehydrogenase small subunit
MGFDFTLNGETIRVDGASTTMTLLEFLRSSGLTGTKQGCAEGDCGACTVAVLDRDASGRPTYRGVNSCIALLPSFAGRDVVTVEGLSRRGEKLHPVQESMVESYGSQCGYCTPGFVMSLFEGYYRGDCTKPCHLSDQLSGNLCRCTGYRPIRDAALAALEKRDACAGVPDPFRERLSGRVEPVGDLDYASGADRFLRPTSLGSLFAALREHPKARIVAGATEIGVDVTKKAASFPVLVSTEGIPVLSSIEKTGEAWRIGASATITSVGEALGEEYPSFSKMVRVFAARQIRNRATLGGNLATASPIGDSAPVLISLDASIVLASEAGERRVALADFFVSYRKTLLQPGEIILRIELPRSKPDSGVTRRSDFLKVSKRRELDISIVAGAFSVDVDAGGIVRRARIAFGGVAATPARARRAEAALLGRPLSDVSAVSAILSEEFKPIDDVRGSADYRRGLVLSLWEKFVSGETSVVQDGDLDFEKGSGAPAPDSSRALRHESAVGHVTGRALYVDDTAQRRPMLDLWPVCAPHARARITRRDATKARSMPGIVCVLLAEDIPGHNNVGPLHDEPMFADTEVSYHGQVVALVVGESLKACRAAAAAVEVDYEPLPAIVGIKEAIAQNSFHSPPHTLRRGDSEASLAAAPFRIDGEFSYGGQEHFYLETQAAWAEAGEGGSVFVSSSTQHPSEIQAIVAEVLGEPRNKVVVQSPRMGGGFGGKETQGNAYAAMVALASVKTGRPARIQLDRDMDMMLTGKRHPFYSRFSVGFDAEGRLLALAADLFSDGGWSKDLSQPVLDRALFHIDNGYYIPALRVTGLIAKTNVASNTAFRGFGGPQGMIVIEEVVDRVARHLGLAPEVVRSRNLYRGSGETNTTHYFQEIGDNRLQTVWKKALDQAGFEARRREVDAWNRTHARVKRGLAITPLKFGISFTLTHYNQAGALVLLYADGTAQVSHGGTEMGQGLHTKVQGVAMRELGLPEESVRMMQTTTEKVPNTSPTAASSGADLNGAAVRNACITLRERLLPVAADLLAEKAGSAVSQADVEFSGGCARVRGTDVAVEMAKVCSTAHFRRISLAVSGYYATPGIHWDWSTASGRPFQYFVCGAAVAEVEVDGFNGMHRVLRVDVVEDVGNSLNPGIDVGQIEGGLVQGIGWLTREELLWDKKGRLLTHSASTYQIPAISDAPVTMNITLLPMASQDGTIHGSKASGEPPFMLAFSVREAIRDAVSAFGRPGGQVSLPSPATGEAIFAAVRRRLS